ncbi:MAG: helix-turn-helix transcriptional regulator [Bdellovibrionales bacterium]|nr:helix-turn-helix transcriptional regulator [Bdellovibrionales bacterium]
MLEKGLEGASTADIREIRRTLNKFSSILRDRRERLGLTQEAFAERVNVNVNTVKYIEQGRRIASLPMILRLARALDLDLKLLEVKP